MNWVVDHLRKTIDRIVVTITAKISNFFTILIRTLFGKKTFFPKNYILWIIIYFLIDYFIPVNHKNPFSVEGFGSDKLSVNQTYLLLLIAYPTLVYIDTLSFAKFLKKSLAPVRFYLILVIGISWVLFVKHVNQFEHFGSDGITNSLFFGLSYLFVLLASVAGFISGAAELR